MCGILKNPTIRQVAKSCIINKEIRWKKEIKLKNLNKFNGQFFSEEFISKANSAKDKDSKNKLIKINFNSFTECVEK